MELPFRVATGCDNVSGKFIVTVQTSSRKCTAVEPSHYSTLVAWLPIIDRQPGCEVMGTVKGDYVVIIQNGTLS